MSSRPDGESVPAFDRRNLRLNQDLAGGARRSTSRTIGLKGLTMTAWRAHGVAGVRKVLPGLKEEHSGCRQLRPPAHGIGFALQFNMGPVSTGRDIADFTQLPGGGAVAAVMNLNDFARAWLCTHAADEPDAARPAHSLHRRQRPSPRSSATTTTADDKVRRELTWSVRTQRRSPPSGASVSPSQDGIAGPLVRTDSNCCQTEIGALFRSRC